MRWKNNSLVSLELRDGTYVLLQMLDRNGWMAALNQYRDVDRWNGVQLFATDVLFVTCVLRGFLMRSNLKRVEGVEPIVDLRSPSGPKTRLNTGPGWREVTLWPDTEDEISVPVDGGDGQMGLHTTGRGAGGETVDQFEKIDPSEYRTYEKTETAHLGAYPTLNERLLLCRGKDWNFDPMRSLLFGWPLDRECSVFAKIISGKVRLDELGYAG